MNAVTRDSVKDYFDNSWTLFETLFAGLNGEEYFYRPPVHGLRHPQIFYYGHSPCLYINKLRVAGVLEKPVNPYFESIFEVGVDEMLWDDMHKNDMMWPTVSEVHEYRKRVYEVIVNTIMTHPSLDDSHGPVLVNKEHPMWALFMVRYHTNATCIARDDALLRLGHRDSSMREFILKLAQFCSGRPHTTLFKPQRAGRRFTLLPQRQRRPQCPLRELITLETK